MSPTDVCDQTELFQRFDDICQRRGPPEPADAVRALAFGGRGSASSPTALVADTPRIAVSLVSPYLRRTNPGCVEGKQDATCSEAYGEGADGAPTIIAWVDDYEGLKQEAFYLQSAWVELVKKPARAAASGVANSQLLTSKQVAELRAQQDESDADNSRWLAYLWGNLGSLRKRTKALQHDGQLSRVDTIQRLTRGVERDLEVFTQQQRDEFESLAVQEQTLEDELMVIGRRFAGWISEPSALARRRTSQEVEATREAAVTAPSVSPVAADDAELAELKAELARINAEIEQSGGLYGGWSQANHDLFLRIMRMFKTPTSAACLARLATHFTHLTQAQLTDRIQWLAESDAQQAKRRGVLAQWRERKEELERQAAATQAEQIAEDKELRRKAEEKVRRSQSEQKRKIAEWRQQRSEAEELATVEQQREEEAQARVERELARQQQMRLKEATEIYRSQKDAGRQQATQRPASARQRALSVDDRQRIAMRSCELLKKKLQVGLRSRRSILRSDRRVSTQREGTARMRKSRAGCTAIQSPTCKRLPKRLHHLLMTMIARISQLCKLGTTCHGSAPLLKVLLLSGLLVQENRQHRLARH